MPKNSEVERAAREFYRRYGRDAPHEAGIRIQELGDFGNFETRDLWIQIRNAINMLIKEEGPPGG